MQDAMDNDTVEFSMVVRMVLFTIGFYSVKTDKDISVDNTIL